MVEYNIVTSAIPQEFESMVGSNCCQGNQAKQPPVTAFFLFLLLFFWFFVWTENLGTELFSFFVVLLDLLVVFGPYFFVSFQNICIALVKIMGFFDVCHGPLVVVEVVSSHRALKDCLHVVLVDGDGFRVQQLGISPLTLVEAASTHVEQ